MSSVDRVLKLNFDDELLQFLNCSNAAVENVERTLQSYFNLPILAEEYYVSHS